MHDSSVVFSQSKKSLASEREMLPKVNGSSTNETMFSRQSSGKDKMDTAMTGGHDGLLAMISDQASTSAVPLP